MIIAIWCCVGLLLAVQARIALTDDASVRFSWWSLLQQAGRAIYWALLTPLVLQWGARWPFAGRWRYLNLGRHLGLALALSLVFYLLRVPAFYWFMEVPEHQRNLDRLLAGLSLRNLIDPVLYFGIVVAGKALAAAQERQAQELREERLHRRLAEAELAALRQQVQPHFLFNAMNTAASLVRSERPADAVRVLGLIGALHRRLVECSGRPECTLEEEFKFARDYLEVERVRFGDRLQVRTELPEDGAALIVPTLLLQPLVENAIKHGIASRRAGGEVELRAWREGGDLHVSVANDFNPAAAPADGTGFGLRHTRERLARLATGAGAMEITRADGRHVVRLRLPARMPPDGATPDSP